MACSVCSANVEKKLNSLEGMKREVSNAGYDLVIEEDRSAEEIGIDYHYRYKSERYGEDEETAMER